MTRELILIHGRSTKPAGSAQKQLLSASLLNGLNRVSAEAAEAIRSGHVGLQFAYYGDVNNRLMVEAHPDIGRSLAARNDEQYNFAPCLPKEPIQAAIDQLAGVTAHDGAAYAAFLAANRRIGWIDEAASVVSAMASVTGLSEYVLRRVTADMSKYLLTRKIGSEVRERLQQYLRPALAQAQDVCVISHSMGCIVAYDVLWKLSRMSEYRYIQETNNRVSLWLTLGCPLGEPGVRANLYDSAERGEDRFPRNVIGDWVNVAAEDDFVAHDATMIDDFRDMLDLGFVNSITDRSIYNFWKSEGAFDAHSFYGYLDHPLVASHIASWILAGSGRDAVPEPRETFASVQRHAQNRIAA